MQYFLCSKSLQCKFTDSYKDTLGNAATYNEQCGSGNSATLYHVFWPYNHLFFRPIIFVCTKLHCEQINHGVFSWSLLWPTGRIVVIKLYNINSSGINIQTLAHSFIFMRRKKKQKHDAPQHIMLETGKQGGGAQTWSQTSKCFGSLYSSH